MKGYIGSYSVETPVRETLSSNSGITRPAGHHRIERSAVRAAGLPRQGRIAESVGRLGRGGCFHPEGHHVGQAGPRAGTGGEVLFVVQ